MQPLSEYLRNKEIRTNLPFRYNGATNERGYILAGVCLASEDHIKAMYPLSGKVRLWNFQDKGKNPDGTHVR